MESLTARVLRFQRTGEEREAIIRDVACKIYEYPRRKCRWDEEASSEFFARVYPKIQGMIERFRYVGRPFESYLASTLLFQVRTFAQDRRRREMEWRAASSPDLWDVELSDAGEDGPEQTDDGGATVRPAMPMRAEQVSWDDMSREARELFEMSEDGTIPSRRARKRFLVACLTSAHLLSDSDVTAIARMVGRDEESLHAVVQRLRSRSRDRLDRLELFTRRRNKAFSSLRLTDARLALETDPMRRLALESRRNRLVGTLRSCTCTISRIRLGPSHRQIAEALGMPKASVDSTMHRLKRRAAAVYAPRHAEYA